MHFVCHYSLTPCSLSRVELASKVLVKTQETQNRLNGRKLNWHRLLSAQLLIEQIVTAHDKKGYFALKFKIQLNEPACSPGRCAHGSKGFIHVLQAVA